MRLLVAISEAGSISEGASRSNLAVAAASTRVKHIEQSLGTAIMRRGRRGVALTPAGDTLLHHARTMLRQIEHLKNELNEHTRGVRGVVRLLSNSNAMTEFLPGSLTGFLARHPTISVDLEERLSHEIVRAVGNDAADIGIIAGTVDVARLRTFPFRRDQLVLVVSPKHPLAMIRETYFSDALDYEFVGLDHQSAIQIFLCDIAARLGRNVQFRVRLRSLDAVCRMAEEGIGIGVVPASTAARCARHMVIKAIALRDEWAERDLRICVRELASLPRHAQLLVQHLTSS